MMQLLAALGDDIRETGAGRWKARCKVHDDKDFAMSIKQNSDGSIIAHCFACGANGLDLYNHLGLDKSELFGKSKDSSYVPQKVKDDYQQARFFIAIYDADVQKGIKPSYQDTKSYNRAKARMRGMENKFGADRL